MGCAGDWAPDCDQAQMTQVDGIWRLTVDLPAGDYEYKVATEKSWDENYGQGGVASGPNLVLRHAGGPVTFWFDPRTKVVQSSDDGPVVTLAGSFQSELGCAGDWAPDCLRAMMFDGDRDGVYEFSTTKLPTGSYELKVTRTAQLGGELRRRRRARRREHRVLGHRGQARLVPLRRGDAPARDRLGRPAAPGTGQSRALDRRRHDRVARRAGAPAVGATWGCTARPRRRSRSRTATSPGRTATGDADTRVGDG
jgi:hypothetical protein